MAKSQEKIKAIKLRRAGRSIRSIAQDLNVSKSTASLWCREVILSKKQEERLFNSMVQAGHLARLKGARVNREKKERMISHYQSLADKNIGTLSERDMLMLGIALYWAEGSKTSGFAFSNSDPAMILLVFKLLLGVMGVAKKDITIRVLINEIHRSRINTILNFWLDLLDLPFDQMYSPTFIKTTNKKVYANHERYYGTISLRVKKSSSLQYYILGLINSVKNTAGVAQVVRASHS